MFQSEHSSPSGPRGASSRSAPSIGAHQLLIKAVEGSVRRDQMNLQYPMTRAAISVGFTQPPRIGGIDPVMIFFPGNMGMWEFANDMPCNLAPEQPAGIFGGLVRERIEFGACDIGNSIEPVADEIEHPRQIGAECMLSDRKSVVWGRVCQYV